MIKYMVRNGFTRPYHPLQVLSWAIVLILAGTFYSLTLPPLYLDMQVLSGISYSIISIVMCIFGFKVTSIDPTDPAVLAAFNSQISGYSLNSIELDLSELTKLCKICKVHVHSDSKHCRECNRCVNNFDHHCKWLNNCIGKMNYRQFIGTILSLQGLMAVQILSSIYLLIAIDNGWEEKENVKEMLGHAKKGIEGIYIYHIVVVIISSLVFIVVGHLFGFHVWLMIHHMSTYQYILSRRADKAKRSNKTTPDANPNESIQRYYEPYIVSKEEDEELPFRMDRRVPNFSKIENSLNKENSIDNTFYHLQIAEDLKKDKLEIITNKENSQDSTYNNSQLAEEKAEPNVN
ncbi:unnamed protein product [Blepharisma stoltei]|uniref:Palmitoyltransferase n=1 Tax=Blepharisma stoltei TaxID=1481888 RepID=A0AAU9IY89_9CILI|nr:unnamed protein product [Blepharisma stoltei]